MVVSVIQNVRQAGDLDQLRGIVSQIVGEVCWGVRLSYAEELTLDIGEHIPYANTQLKGKEKGSWVLGSRGTAWELTSSDGLWVSSEDEEDTIQQKILAIKDTIITGVDIRYPILDLALVFNSGHQLTILPAEEEETDVAYWELFTPNNMVIEAGPGPIWSYSRADIPIAPKNR